jgi:CubicO group peptidase (beta-lactamase class C family)
VIHGSVRAGFEPVRDAFAANFTQRHELGGACCVYLHGEKVVDLWGGVRNRATGAAWEEDTMVLVHSATKGLSAMSLALAHSRGWLDYDARVCRYWPEFAQRGKQSTTIRQLLAHQAGLFAFDEPIDRAVFADPDRLAVVLARQVPAWEPGSRTAYHALSLGFYQSELLRRVDPDGRTLGQFFQDEIATPLAADFFIRLPESIPDSRLAVLDVPGFFARLKGFPLAISLAAFNPRSVVRRSLVSNPAAPLPYDERRVYARNLEVPSGGGVGTARGIARAYGEFAAGGQALKLRAETLAALAAPAAPSRNGYYDDFMQADVHFSLGFMKSFPGWPFGSPAAFGAPGAGGSLGYADPRTGIGYGYVTSRMGTCITGDPRDVALRRALDAIVPV